MPSPSSKDGSEAAGTAASAAADSSSSSSSSNSSSSSSSSSSSYSSSLRTARHLRKRIVSSLKACQSPTGGFGGGNQQLSHCAPTYAAVLALVAVGGAGGSAGSGGGGDTGSGSSSASANGSGEKNAEKDEEEDVEVQKLAYGAIDRPALYSWMLSLKVKVLCPFSITVYRRNYIFLLRSLGINYLLPLCPSFLVHSFATQPSPCPFLCLTNLYHIRTPHSGGFPHHSSPLIFPLMFPHMYLYVLH